MKTVTCETLQVNGVLDPSLCGHQPRASPRSCPAIDLAVRRAARPPRPPRAPAAHTTVFSLVTEEIGAQVPLATSSSGVCPMCTGSSSGQMTAHSVRTGSGLGRASRLSLQSDRSSPGAEDSDVPRTEPPGPASGSCPRRAAKPVSSRRRSGRPAARVQLTAVEDGPREVPGAPGAGPPIPLSPVGTRIGDAGMTMIVRTGETARSGPPCTLTPSLGGVTCRPCLSSPRSLEDAPCGPRWGR